MLLTAIFSGTLTRRDCLECVSGSMWMPCGYLVDTQSNTMLLNGGSMDDHCYLRLLSKRANDTDALGAVSIEWHSYSHQFLLSVRSTIAEAESRVV